MNKSLKKELLRIPHFSITDSIPMRSISEEGIIEVRKGLYSKTYRMQDINFNQAKLEDKVEIFYSKESLKIVIPESRNYYDVLREKLKWGENLC